MTPSRPISFFPDPFRSKASILIDCSPNNPTGAAATFSQLEELVDYAKRHRSIIIYDTAYGSYIQEPAYSPAPFTTSKEPGKWR